MKKFQLLLIVVLIQLLSAAVMADIVVTKDGMVLNGKILEEIKDEYVKIANYHGSFTIDYAMIKEIHRTERYEDDIIIFEKLGKKVDKALIKQNYLAGTEKLKKDLQTVKDKEKPSLQYMLLVSPFFLFNLGKIESVLPYSFGVSLQNDIRFYSKYQFLPNTLSIEARYLHAEETFRRIISAGFYLGTAWVIPLTSKKVTCNIVISPAVGAGYYEVKGEYRQTADIKLNASFTSGFEFLISSWVISPVLRFEYVHDEAKPLYGIGFSLGAGYIFSWFSDKNEHGE